MTTDPSAVESYAGPLLSILAKHAEMTDAMHSPVRALTSLAEIERCIGQARAELPPREMQVCARMLHGISTEGIALALGISEESVITYRKRAYQRLGIGSRRELLLWYLSRWGAQQQDRSI